MNRKRNGHLKYGLAFAALLALLLLFLGWSLCAGSVEIPLEEVAEVFAWKLGCAPAPGASSAAGIVWEIRFPRALAAILLGGALGLSGYLLQTFFRNPIAGPFVLGISSGAKLLVACLMVFSLGHGTGAPYGRKSGADGGADPWRHHDRLYLLGSYGHPGDLC